MAREEDAAVTEMEMEMETDAQGQQQALAELDALQERVLAAVGVASQAMEALSALEELDEVAVQTAYGEYLGIMKEVHEGLATRAHWIRHYVPYQRSAEKLREEVAVLELRLGQLKQEARRLGHRGEAGDAGE